MLIDKDHPNYKAYLKASHQLSLEMSARIQAVAEAYGEGDEGITKAKELQIEEARRRKALQEEYAAAAPAGDEG